MNISWFYKDIILTPYLKIVILTIILLSFCTKYYIRE